MSYPSALLRAIDAILPTASAYYHVRRLRAAKGNARACYTESNTATGRVERVRAEHEDL